jgi:hypothetical protein
VPQQRLGDEIERGHARDDAQELADKADGLTPELQQQARDGGGNIDHGAAVPHQDAAAIRAVIAVKRPQQSRFAASRGRIEHDALAGTHGEIDAVEHRQPHPALRVQRETLGKADDLEHGARLAHAASTEETSSWV